jgi:tricorn protease interacting factor F2/3
MAANAHAIPHMWGWYVSNLDALEQFHPMHYERVIASIIPLSGIGREEEIKTFYKDYMSEKEKAKDIIKLSLEKLEINSRMRRS